MSQAGAISVSGGGGGGPLDTLTPDQGGVVNPVANNINVFGQSSTINNVNGIRTFNGGAGELDIRLTNRATGTATTTGASTATLITLALGATPGVYTFDILVSGFAATGIGSPAGCGYTIVGAVRTDGATATLLPTQVVDHFEDAVLGVAPQAQAVLAVSGNNALVTVTGKDDGAGGFSIRWTGTLTYNLAS